MDEQAYFSNITADQTDVLTALQPAQTNQVLLLPMCRLSCINRPLLRSKPLFIFQILEERHLLVACCAACRRALHVSSPTGILPGSLRAGLQACREKCGPITACWGALLVHEWDLVAQGRQEGSWKNAFFGQAVCDYSVVCSDFIWRGHSGLWNRNQLL